MRLSCGVVVRGVGARLQEDPKDRSYFCSNCSHSSFVFYPIDIIMKLVKFGLPFLLLAGFPTAVVGAKDATSHGGRRDSNDVPEDAPDGPPSDGRPGDGLAVLPGRNLVSPTDNDLVQVDSPVDLDSDESTASWEELMAAGLSRAASVREVAGPPDSSSESDDSDDEVEVVAGPSKEFIGERDSDSDSSSNIDSGSEYQLEETEETEEESDDEYFVGRAAILTVRMFQHVCLFILFEF